MEIKNSRTKTTKNLFFIFSFSFYFSQPTNEEQNLDELLEDLKPKVEELNERLKEIAEELKLPELLRKIEEKKNKKEHLFTKEKFLLSRNEILHRLFVQALILFFCVFFSYCIFVSSWLNFTRGTDRAEFIFFIIIHFLLLIVVCGLQFHYFFSRCHTIAHSDSPWTALSFISFFIFIILNRCMNSSLFEKTSREDGSIEKFIVFKLWAGYYKTNANQSQSDEFLLFEKITIFNNQNFGYNILGLAVCIIFFIGLVAETYFFCKEVKINRFWIILSDGCIFLITFYSVFVYRGINTRINVTDVMISGSNI